MQVGLTGAPVSRICFRATRNPNAHAVDIECTEFECMSTSRLSFEEKDMVKKWSVLLNKAWREGIARSRGLACPCCQQVASRRSNVIMQVESPPTSERTNRFTTARARMASSRSQGGREKNSILVTLCVSALVAAADTEFASLGKMAGCLNTRQVSDRATPATQPHHHIQQIRVSHLYR